MQSAGIKYENVEVFAGVKGLPLEEALQIILGSVNEGELSFHVEDDGLHFGPLPVNDSTGSLSLRDQATAALQKKIQVSAAGIPLTKLLSHWSQELDVPIHVQDGAIEQFSQRPVHLVASGMKFDHVLATVLQNTGLEHRVEETGIYIRRAPSTERSHIKSMLEHQQTSFRFDAAPLRDVFGLIERRIQSKVHFDPDAAEQLSLDRVVTSNVSEQPIGSAIEEMLAGLPGGPYSVRAEADGIHIAAVSEKSDPTGIQSDATANAVDTAPRLNLVGRDDAVKDQQIRALEEKVRALQALREELPPPSVKRTEQESAGSSGPSNLKPIDDLLKMTDKVQANAIRNDLKPLRQRQTIQTFQSQKPNDQLIRQALDQNTEFQVAGNTFQEVMSFIGERYKFTVRLDTSALTEAGVGLDTEINLELNNVSLRSALEILFEDVQGTQLDYFVEDEVLKVTTKERADAKVQTLVYGISSLGMEAPQVQEVLESSVEPESWESNGGQGTIVSIDKGLVVTTSRRLHDRTAELLQMLQEHADAKRE